MNITERSNKMGIIIKNIKKIGEHFTIKIEHKEINELSTCIVQIQLV